MGEDGGGKERDSDACGVVWCLKLTPAQTKNQHMDRSAWKRRSGAACSSRHGRSEVGAMLSTDRLHNGEAGM